MQAETPEQQDHFPTKTQLPALRSSITQNDTSVLAQKLQNFVTLDLNQKLLTIDNIVVILDEIGKQGVEILEELLDNIGMEDGVVAARLLGKIEEIVGYVGKYTGKQEFEAVLKKTIIPLVIRYLNSPSLQTKQQSAKLLSTLSPKLPEKDQGECILKYVLLLSHDDSNENNRLVAVQLLSSLSLCLGATLCEQFIGLEFLSLGDDLSENVRKEAIKCLPVICKMVSEHFFTYKILPFYYEKAADRVNWGIRKACADIIISIGQFTSEQERQSRLTAVMLKLLKDDNKWVRLSAYLSLGKFIFLLKGLQVHQKLVKRYLKMTQKQIIQLGNDNQIPYSCAYNFPAVVSVIGPNKWPDMVKTYQKLLEYKDRNIKITLCLSLHQIAKIIGGNQTEKYLFKVIDNFLEDESDDIKLGIIQNMSEIIFVLNDQKREKMISIFQEFRQNKKKWRIRLAIARQFQNLLEMYPPETTHMYIVPILLGFCSDPVAELREQAAKNVPHFLQSFKNNETLQLGLVQSLKGFSVSPLHSQRLQFISICHHILKSDLQTFGKYFLQPLSTLLTDPVPNIRLALAQLLHNALALQNVKTNIMGIIEGTGVGPGLAPSKKMVRNCQEREQIVGALRAMAEDMREGNRGDGEIMDIFQQ